MSIRGLRDISNRIQSKTRNILKGTPFRYHRDMLLNIHSTNTNNDHHC